MEVFMKIRTQKILFLVCTAASCIIALALYGRSPKFSQQDNRSVTTKTSQQQSKKRNDAIFNHEHPREEDFWQACEHLKNDPTFNPKDDIAFVHQIGKAYRTTTFAKEQFAQQKQDFGSRPANKKTRTIIIDSLKQANCPVIDMPIYQLDQCNIGSATGVTSAQAIWINEREIGDDAIELARACTHEAGHWYYQHSLWSMIYSKVTSQQREFDADEFSFHALTPKLRKQVLARAKQKISPKNFIRDEQLKELLQPQLIQRNGETIYSLTLPEQEHSENIVAVAQKTALQLA